MSNWHFIKRAFQYQIKAQTKYYLHSPFVFSLYNEVLDRSRFFYAYSEIENLRTELLKDASILKVHDLGAGSRMSKSNERKVKEITKYAAISPKFGELLFQLVHFSKAKNIVELGTSMGLGTAYLAKADARNKIVSMEGCPNISAKAKSNLQQINIENIDFLVGDFSEQLPKALQILNNKIDLAYLDGNHQYAPTIAYFNTIKNSLHENSVVVLDDIHWSLEMEKAWNELKALPEVSVSIDLFRMGILFFHKNQEKQDFTIRF